MGRRNSSHHSPSRNEGRWRRLSENASLGLSGLGGVRLLIFYNANIHNLRKKYGGKVLLVQDNARCHVSQSTRDYLEREGVKVLRMQ